MLRELVAVFVVLVALPASASAAPRAISETALRGFDLSGPKCVELERDVSVEAHPGKLVAVRPECIGPACSGKEADDEVGVVYFGERYLIPRIGRWASPDPLHVHAVGGGEALNSYHYVSGSVLQARDPLGLNTLWLGGAGYEEETRGYSVPIVEKMREAGVPEPEYVPIGSSFGQAGNIAATLDRRSEPDQGRPSLLRAMAEGAARHEATATLDRVVHASNESGGTRNLVGYSYGSVMAAQAALRLATAGERVDTLVLVGTPMSPDSELYRSLLDNENIGVVVRIDIKGDPFSAGIDPSRGREMDRHFYFIDNDRSQQDWLADVVAASVRGAEGCRADCPREIVLNVDPTSRESAIESSNSASAAETTTTTTDTSEDRDD